MEVAFAPFLMVIAIVAIVQWGKVTRAREANRVAGAEAMSLDEAARLKAEVARLSQRVQVLERLAIDPSKRLADEIAALDRNA